jgi:hypothetical protein
MADHHSHGGGGLRGHDDKRSGLRDVRSGAYDKVRTQPGSAVDRGSLDHAGQREQQGASVRDATTNAPPSDLPERLRRDPVGPDHKKAVTATSSRPERKNE